MQASERPHDPLQPSKILIIDDEEAICSFLQEALEDTYEISTCYNGTEALAQIDAHTFDVIITDLRLPDISGIDILRHAKQKDEFVEVIMITGYASLDSATKAINLGASSYLMKPLRLDEFTDQVDRAVASRAFHVKSMRIMQHTGDISPDFKSHLYDVTTLYNFSRRLMLSLELPEVFQIILDDANDRMDIPLASIAIDFLEFSEIFAMPHYGSVSQEDIEKVIKANWDGCFDFLDKRAFEKGEISLSVLEGRKGPAPSVSNMYAAEIPMIVKGKTIGALVLFSPEKLDIRPETYQFLYVYTSLISSIVEHAYVDMQAQLLAKTDSLTGIANHRMFDESIGREIARADRNQLSFSLALIDIDDFKKVNDTHGHLVGDKVLRDLTQRICSLVRKGDLLARYGGEEFALILPDTSVEGGEALAERIRKEISDTPLQTRDGDIGYTISIGLSIYDGTAPKAKDQLIDEADRALYQSKRNGKNQISVA